MYDLTTPVPRRRAAPLGIAAAALLVLLAPPLAANAAAVDLGTVTPFVVLAGSTATNTGPSVLLSLIHI